MPDTWQAYKDQWLIVTHLAHTSSGIVIIGSGS
jgi:hypothetical protein